jgi:hypothetical protein
MTPAQHERLLAWAYRAQMAAIDAAAARDAATPLALTQVGAGIETARLKYDLDQLWHDYRWEIQPLTFHAGVLAILQRWGAYSQDLNPANFHPKPDDIDRLWEDTRRLRAWIATWRRLHETPPAEEDPDHGA